MGPPDYRGGGGFTRVKTTDDDRHYVARHGHQSGWRRPIPTAARISDARDRLV
jgi:hypothetical protein